MTNILKKIIIPRGLIDKGVSIGSPDGFALTRQQAII